MRKGIYEDHKQLKEYIDKQLYNLITKNAVAYLGQIVITGLAPPHKESQPLAAPGSGGGTSFSWLVSKHTMLCWPKTTVQQFGQRVVDIFEGLCQRRGAIFNGLVGVPLFCCGNVKHFSTRNGQPLAAGSREPSFTLPCGKRALMTPLLKLNESRKCWRCENCVQKENPDANTIDSDFRVFQVWPLVKKVSRTMDRIDSSPWQTKATMLKAGNVEIMCGAPPPKWQWPNEQRHFEIPDMNYTMHLKQVLKISMETRFRFEDVDSEFLWRSAERYEPVKA